MREYRYSALTSSGQTVSGIRQSENAQVLAAELLEIGLILLKGKPTLGSFGQMFSSSGRAGKKELRDFTQHMATCLSAGIPAVSALADFQELTKGPFREVVADIRGDVSSGTAIDEAFARHPQIFPTVYLAMLSAGQNSGNLDQIFEELVAYLEWKENLRSQTTQALIYPSMLMVGIIGLFLLMMLFVIPRFETMFEDVGFELPTLTVKVMAMGAFMGHWWWLIFGSIALATIGLKLYFQTDSGAYNRDRFLLKVPVLGGFLQKLALSRFSKSFALIFASGLDLLRLLDLMQGLVGNQVMARQIAFIRNRVATGESLTDSFADADSFPPLIQRLVAVGEKTGSLENSMMRASQYLDKEIPRDLKKAFTVFEGIIIAVMGVVVCIAAMSLLMPIMQMGGNLH
jgi:type II secretory pathway component PulF